MPDGSVTSKIKEVNAVVRDIIGIDRNQFTQIVMIAQGDFLKLLIATTDERKKIFRQLFHTEHFDKLQERLKLDTKNLREKYETLKASIFHYASGISCYDESLLSELENVKSGESGISEIKDFLKKLLKICSDSIFAVDRKSVV